LSFLFCLIADDRALASFWPSRSSRYVGNAPSGTADVSACLTLLSSWALRVFLSWTFSAWRLACRILALRPKAFWATADDLCAVRASFLRLQKVLAS
jgi:hypothetical protein